MEFRTIAEEASAVLVEKRSRFVAALSPAGSETEARQFIDSVRARHPDARHHVFAYRLVGGASRFSDDDEPQGTAGAPVLEVLKRRELLNVAAVVTRYFGGVLLGAPGLTRVYSRAALMAADAARVVVMRRCAVYALRIGYADLAGLERMLRRAGGHIGRAEYGAQVALEAVVPEDCAPEFLAGVESLTAGAVVPVLKSEIFCT